MVRVSVWAWAFGQSVLCVRKKSITLWSAKFLLACLHTLFCHSPFVFVLRQRSSTNISILTIPIPTPTPIHRQPNRPSWFLYPRNNGRCVYGCYTSYILSSSSSSSSSSILSSRASRSLLSSIKSSRNTIELEGDFKRKEASSPH